MKFIRWFLAVVIVALSLLIWHVCVRGGVYDNLGSYIAVFVVAGFLAILMDKFLEKKVDEYFLNYAYASRSKYLSPHGGGYTFQAQFLGMLKDGAIFEVWMRNQNRGIAAEFEYEGRRYFFAENEIEPTLLVALKDEEKAHGRFRGVMSRCGVFGWNGRLSLVELYAEVVMVNMDEAFVKSAQHQHSERFATSQASS